MLLHNANHCTAREHCREAHFIFLAVELKMLLIKITINFKDACMDLRQA